MKVVLIAPPIMDYDGGRLVSTAMDAHRVCPPYGMYLLAGTLKSEGHDVVLIDLIADGSNDITPYAQALSGAGLLGLGCTSMCWPTACDVIRQIRQVTDAAIVLGGIHPTMFDRYILERFPVEFIIRGEGELSLVALVDAIEKRIAVNNISGLSWKALDGTIVQNPTAGKISKEALPLFPIPAYELLPDQVYQGLALESSRGCVFDCSFCSTSYRTTWRGMEVRAFVDRMEAVLPYLQRTKLKNLQIIDDEFSMNPKRAIEITKEMVKRHINVPLIYDSRANDLLFPNYVESIAPFTCQFLIGAECGYDEGLKKIGKGTTCEKLILAAKKLQECGIASRADFSFILGLPWETKTEVDRTVDFALHLHGTYGVRILLQWYCQIPGSRLWDEDYKAQIVNESMYDDYGFFRNLYLFRSAVKLTPEEIYDVGERLAPIQVLAQVMGGGRKMVEHSFPMPIASYYPTSTLKSHRKSGISNLREVAHTRRREITDDNVAQKTESLIARVQPGIPLRHFEGVNS